MINQVKPTESVDFQLLLVAPKAPDKSTAYSIVHKESMNSNLLFVDLPLPKDTKSSYKSISLADLITLKDNHKRECKKMIKNFTVIVPSTIAAKILKSFGKIFQRYNKTPVLLSSNLDSATIEKRQYYRLESKRLQGKLGTGSETESVLTERLQLIVESITAKGYTVVEKMVKSTQGKPTRL
jgi:ribosomal protein L1